MTYDEFIREVPNPSHLVVLSLAPLAGASILHLPLPVAMAAVDRLLGGTGAGRLPNRALTDIEASLIRNLLGRVLRELAYAFESLTTVEASIIHQESNPQFAQIASPTDMVIILGYDVKIGGVGGTATLCIPFTSLQPVLDEVTGNARLAGRITTDPQAVRAALAQRVEDATVPVTVRFPEITLSMAEIVDLRPGDVVPLHHPTDAALEVSVAGIRRFSAKPGRRGKRLACQVTAIETKDQTP
jgi:flagellar motor switch protein FliM